jgi:hypothetical protein
MPDWFTHTLVGWIIGKTAKLDIGLVVAGSLIPDLYKITLAFSWLKIDTHHFLDPLHMPVGAFIIGAIFALFFINSKKVFIFLSVGILSHFILDFFLVHVSGGMIIFFPFSWNQYQVYIMRPEDYLMTIVALIAALIVYIYYSIREKTKKKESLIK